MEFNDTKLKVVRALQQIFSPFPNVSEPAEKYLESVEVCKNYPLLLLSLVDNVNVDLTIRIAGSIVFKNYVKRNWKIIDDINKIDPADRQAVKSTIVDLMLKSPPNIKKQLSDAICIIGLEDARFVAQFRKCLLVYWSVFINKKGPSAFISKIDSITPKFMKEVLGHFIAGVEKVSGKIERKICAVGITKLLCEAPEVMLNGEYCVYWGPLLTAVVKLFELPEDEHFVEIEESPGYQTAYSRLNFAGKPEVDPLKDSVPNARIYLAQSLGKLSTASPGKLVPLTSSTPPEVQQFLGKILSEANVQLM